MRGVVLTVMVTATSMLSPIAHALTRQECAAMATETERNVVAFNQMVEALGRKMSGKQLSEMSAGRIKRAAAEAERATLIMMPDLRAYAAAMDALAIELRACAR